MATIATLAVSLLARHEQFTESMDRAGNAVAGFEHTHLSLRRVLENTTTSEEKYQRQVEQLNSWYDKGRISAENYGRALAAAHAQLERMAHSAEKAGTAQEFFEKQLDRAGRVLEVLLVYEATRKLVEFTVRSMEAGEKTIHMAQAIGISTEAFGRLQYAAEATHAGTEALASAMERMEHNLGYAAIAGGETAMTFQRMGIDVAALKNLSPDQEFRAIVERLGEMSNAADRATLAQAVFGRSWAALIPILSIGANGLDEYGRAAEKAGYLLSENQSRRTEEAVESLTRLRLAVDSVGRQFATALAPYVALGALKLEEFSSRSISTQTAVHAAVQGIGKSASVLADIMEDVRNDALYTGQALLTIGQALNTVGDAVPAFINLITLGLVPGLNKFVGEMHDAHAMMEAMHDDLQKQLDAAHAGASWGSQVTSALGSVNASAQKTAEGMRFMFSGISDLADAAADHVKKVKSEIDPLQRIMERLQNQIDSVGRTPAQVELLRIADTPNPYDVTGHTSTSIEDQRIQVQHYQYELLRQQARQMAEYLDQLDREKHLADQAARAQDAAARAAAEHARSIKGIVDGLKDQIASLQGVDSEHGRLFDRLKDLGATAAQIAQIKAMLEQIDQLKSDRDLRGVSKIGRSAEAIAYDPSHIDIAALMQKDGEANHRQKMEEHVKSAAVHLRNIDHKLPSVTH